MKPILTAVILSCALLNAHADQHYIYGSNGQSFYFSGQYLYDGYTGQEVGYLQGNSLYDSATGQEIGYRSGRYIYSSKIGAVLGYCDGEQ